MILGAGGRAGPLGAVPCDCDVGGVHGKLGLENVLPMPGEEGLVLRADPAEVERRFVGETEEHPVEGIEPRRSLQHAFIVEGDQAGVEEGIELGGEEEAVEYVEAFGVGGAIGPWLGVAGAEEYGQVKTGDGAGTAPVVHERLAEEVLADALFGEPQGLCGTGWLGLDLGDFLGVEVGGVVRQGHREFGGAAEESAQRGLAGGLERTGRALDHRKRPGQFRCRWPFGKYHLPRSTLCGCRHHMGFCLVARGKQDHALWRAFAHVFPAVGIAGFFDEGPFEEIHGVFGLRRGLGPSLQPSHISGTPPHP